MSVCPECGSPFYGLLSCLECAKRQQLNASSGWVCENCGKENRANSDHCWSCASSKDVGSKTAPPSHNVGVRVATALSGSSEPQSHIDMSSDEDSRTKERIYKSRNPIVDRYLDLYRVARLLDGLGMTVKTIGVVLGVAILLLFFIIGIVASSKPASPFGPARSSQTDGGFILVWAIVGVIIGSFVGGVLFILGVLVSAQGQILLAQADAAVHTSPFLTREEKANAMSLSSHAAQQTLAADSPSGLPPGWVP